MLDIKTLKSLDLEFLCLDVTNKGETQFYFICELLETLDLCALDTLRLISDLLEGETVEIAAGTLDTYTIKLRGVIERYSETWDEQAYA